VYNDKATVTSLKSLSNIICYIGTSNWQQYLYYTALPISSLFYQGEGEITTGLLTMSTLNLLQTNKIARVNFSLIHLFLKIFVKDLKFLKKTCNNTTSISWMKNINMELSHHDMQ